MSELSEKLEAPRSSDDDHAEANLKDLEARHGHLTYEGNPAAPHTVVLENEWRTEVWSRIGTVKPYRLVRVAPQSKGGR